MENSNKQNRTCRARRVLGDVLIALVVLFMAYLCAVMIHRINTVVLKDTYRTIFHNELILCGVWLLFILDLRFRFFTLIRFLPLRILGWVLRVLVTVFALAILLLFGKVVVGSFINNAGEAEHVVVLGMALEDGQPTRDLLLRLDTAQRYAETHPDATLILTGGNPDESGRTEAFVMRELLTGRGVSVERMILEDQAASTRENFRNTAQLIAPTESVVFISSDYHMDRAVSMAKEAGFTHIMRRPAPSDPIRYGGQRHVGSDPGDQRAEIRGALNTRKKKNIP